MKPRKPAAPRAEMYPHGFIGQTTGQKQRRRCGVLFFAEPHRYQGVPKREMLMDSYLRIVPAEQDSEEMPIELGMKAADDQRKARLAQLAGTSEAPPRSPASESSAY